MKKIKVIGTLKDERKIIIFLLVLSITMASFSLVFELIVKHYISELQCLTTHIDYFINAMIGITGSSIVSFFCVVFPYKRRMENQINNIMSALKDIYCEYKGLFICILSTSENGSNCDDYSLENTIFKAANKLLKKITGLTKDYEESNFRSEDVSKICKELGNKVTINLSIIQTFCSSALSNRDAESQKTTDAFGVIKKDINFKRAEKDLYKLLLSSILSNYTLDNFENLFSPILGNKTFDVVNNNLITQLEDLVNQISEYDTINADISSKLDISLKFYETITKHSKEYLSESVEINNRLHEIFEKIKGEDKEKQKYYISLSKEIRKAVHNDEMKKAEDLIEKLEHYYGINNK